MQKFTQALKTAVFGILMLCCFAPQLMAEASITIKVTQLSTTDAQVTFTPSDAAIKYHINLREKTDFEQKGGAEGIVQWHIDDCKSLADWYADGTTWQEMMGYAMNKEGEISQSARGIICEPLTANTEYVVYAFGMDKDGNITIPLATEEFTTESAAKSDNTFDITLLTIKKSMEGRMDVTVKVTPSNADTYVARCVPKIEADKYDLTDPTSSSYKNFVKEHVMYGIQADWLKSGENEFTFENRVLDSEYYIVAIGVDNNNATTTSMTTLQFKCEQYPAIKMQTITVEVDNITPMNAHFKITPSDEEMLYYIDVAPTDLVKEKGGVDAIPEKFIIDWWKYIASMYENTEWTEFIPMQTRKGSLDEMAAKLIEDGVLSNLYWNMDWTLYAVGFDLDGNVISNIATFEFTTPDTEKSDLEFDFAVISLEDNEKLSTDKTVYFDVQIDVKPSRDGEKFRAGSCKTIILDQYNGKEDGELNFIKDQFYNGNMSVEFDQYVRLKFEGLRAYAFEGDLQEYYVVAMGWNEGPTTDIYDFKFSYESIPVSVENTNDNGVQVFAKEGAINVLGECDGAAVYSVSGQLMGVIRSGRTLSVPAGVYVVTYKVNGEQFVTKAAVK